jgi:hypothetical protein
LTVGGIDWVFTEKLTTAGKRSVILQSADRKVTQEDIAGGFVSSGTKVGAITSLSVDLSNLPTGVEITMCLGTTLVSYALKYDTN